MKGVSTHSNWVRGSLRKSFYRRSPLTRFTLLQDHAALSLKGRGLTNRRPFRCSHNYISSVRTSTTATRPFSTSATASLNTLASSAGSNTGPLAQAP
jgi:hypothetical protein